MNSSLLSSSEPPTTLLPSAAAALIKDGFYQAKEDVTSFQNAVGNIESTPRLLKNRFEIIRRVGKGGFGTTYLAQDSSATLPLPCVIKQLKYKNQPEKNQFKAETALAKERTQRRFQREARMMARLGRHPQLPCLLDHFIEEDQFYLVQEYIPGDTLSREISRSGAQKALWSEQQVKQFLREMIPIIRYIHRQNLLHLDIKPSNIMRRSHDQKLVLIDFGAVRRYPTETLPGETERGAGTIGFAPSEQLAGQPTYASDLYALGVTCLYLLTKISPLDLATAPQGQRLHWQGAVNLSDHFTRILTKMLHPEASRRFQDTYELERAMNLESHYEDLKSCLTNGSITDKTFSSPNACPLVPNAKEENLSHAQRQAASIRRWQQRRRQFKTFTPS